MPDAESPGIRTYYRLTAAIGLVGFLWVLVAEGPRFGFGFLLGALGSLGNLWLFDWLSRAIAPGEHQHKPWTAGLFMGRYAALWLVGYTTVKGLGVSPVPVLFGLLASTAAVLASSIVQLVRSFIGNTTSQ